jgi:hypothetical protein
VSITPRIAEFKGGVAMLEIPEPTFAQETRVLNRVCRSRSTNRRKNKTEIFEELETFVMHSAHEAIRNRARSLQQRLLVDTIVPFPTNIRATVHK